MIEPSSHFYQAIGVLFGSLLLEAEGRAMLVSGSEKYPIFIPPALLKKHQGKTGYWRVYPQTHKSQPGVVLFQILQFSEQQSNASTQFQLKGDWTPYGLQVWRNPQTFLPKRGPLFALLPIVWDDAPPPDRSFWEVKATFEAGKFRVVHAEGPYPNPPHLDASRIVPPELAAQRTAKKKKKKKKSKSQSQPPEPLQIINWKEISPVPGKLEIILKINTLPTADQVNGLYHFRIECEGRIVQVSLPPKQWKKLPDAAQLYPKWVGVLSGTLGELTPEGFILNKPTLQVFESKAKENTADPETASPAPLPAQQQKAKSEQIQSTVLSRPPAPSGSTRKVGKFTFESR